MSAGPDLRRPTLLSLQYLRGVAALAVLLGHAAAKHSPFLQGTAGFGVALFFLLSGFLMVYVTDASTRPRDFILARALRIVPLYWALTFVVIVILWSGVSRQAPLPFLYLLHDSGHAPWLHIVKSLAFIPSERARGIFPILPQGWTLNLEMLFYAIFALLLILPRRAQVAALSAVLIALTAAGLALRPETPALILWTSPVMLYFVAGAWLGQAWCNGRPLWSTVLFILAAWVPCALIVRGLTPHPPADPRILWPAPLPLLALAAALAIERRPGGVRDWRLPRLAGEASYSIYLWQFIPILALDLMGRRFAISPWQYALAVVVAGLAGGWAVHVLIERPLMRLARRLRRPSRIIPATG